MKKVKKVLKISLIVGTLLGVTYMVADRLSSSAKYHKEDIQMKKIEQSPQYKNGKFRNTAVWNLPSFGQNVSTLWEFVFAGAERSPKKPLPARKVDLEHFANPGGDQLNVTWLGHSSLMTNIDGYKYSPTRYSRNECRFLAPPALMATFPLI